MVIGRLEKSKTSRWLFAWINSHIANARGLGASLMGLQKVSRELGSYKTLNILLTTRPYNLADPGDAMCHPNTTNPCRASAVIGIQYNDEGYYSSAI